MRINHPILGWIAVHLSTKGYPRISGGALRNTYLHRRVFEVVAGRPVKEGSHIHHMGATKLCTCPHQLLELEACLHPASVCRHPFTGRMMSATEWQRLMDSLGLLETKDDEVPF